MNVTPSFFEVLGTTAARGRLFAEADGTPGRNKVVLLSHTFAARQPGGIDAVVGRQLRMDDEVYDVVGVLPETFFFLNPETRVFVPLAFAPEDFREDRRWSQNHELLARLAPGVTLERAQARMDAHNAAVTEHAGALKDTVIRAGYTTSVQPLADDLVRNVRAALQMLWGGVLFVVLIAAVNITNLALVRTNGRIKELATRTAIGARNSRIARQLITEATVLTIAGAALGLLLGYLSLDALEWIGFTDLPRAHEVRIDAMVLAMTLAPAILLGLVVGAASGAPARQDEPEWCPPRRGPVRHRRQDVGLPSAFARRRPGGARVRPRRWIGTPARELSAPPRGEPGLRAGARAHRPRRAWSARVIPTMRRSDPTWSARSRECARCPGSNPRA